VTNTIRSERLSLRLTGTAKEQLRTASELAQQDLSSFVLGAALEKARQVQLDNLVITLSPSDFALLEDVIANPGEPPERLIRLLDPKRRLNKPANTRSPRSE
jgi:uncharacterized protein (DUF1778 family)